MHLQDAIKNKPDELFHAINNYYYNINFTIERNPSKFLDTKIRVKNGKAHKTVFRKPNKFPFTALKLL